MKNQNNSRTLEEIKKDKRATMKKLADLDKEFLEAATREAEETPEQETQPTPKVEEAPAQEAQPTQKVEKTSEQEAQPTKKVEKTPTPEEPKPKKKKKEKKSKDFGILLPILVAFLAVLLSGTLISACLPNRDEQPGVDNGTTDIQPGDSTDTQQPDGTDNTVDTQKPDGTDDPLDTQQPDGTDTPDVPDVPVEFELDKFKTSTLSIYKQYDAKDISANLDILIENIGEDKLKELIEAGELNVQKAIAAMLAFVPEIKMQQYIANNGLDYNPNYDSDYDAALKNLKAAYLAKTGKNPDGVLMSLEGYEINKSNRAAMEAMIIETGDTALLEWYKAKTAAFDTMMQQSRDNKTAEAYKEEVMLELISSTGTVKLLELQLNEEVAGTIAVVDPVSMQYTEAYKNFILNNYIYVVAG